MFDWIQFLNANSIPYITEGKNVRRGNINIKCPLCSDDPSEHMGINAETGKWGCWRKSDHVGRQPARLVAAIKGITFAEAKRLVGGDQEPTNSGKLTIKDMQARLDHLGERQRERGGERVRLDDSLRPIWYGEGSAYRFIKYLEDERGFTDGTKVAKYYEAHYTMTGRWGWRVVFPIRRKGRLIGWTGRAIRKDAELRYDTYPDGPEIKRVLFNFDNARRGGKVLMVVEGPIDALKIDYYGRKHGIRSVAMMGTKFTDKQVAELARLMQHFDETIILFDRKASSEAERLSRSVRFARKPVSVDMLPPSIKDPGDLTPRQVNRLSLRILAGLPLVDARLSDAA